MCCVYNVTPDGYHSWRRRGKSSRRLEDESLYDIIFDIWKRRGKLYGSPKITEAMRQAGHRVGKKRVARIMRENGIKARVATLYRATPDLEAFVAGVPNRQLKELADRPNKVWVGDITYLKVNEEQRYLAVVLDKYSRRVIGWSLVERRDASLTVKALSQALRHRKPTAGLIYYSDRGIEYRAFKFAKRLTRRGITQSINRPRMMNDNAYMESFFHNFKAEGVHGRGETFKTDESQK